MIVIALTLLILAAFAVLVALLAGLWIQSRRTAERVGVLEARIAQLAQASTPVATPSAPVALSPPKASPPVPAPASKKEKEEEISPELLVVMAAAVTVFLGKTVRIRSAKRLQSPYEIVNPWAQQGRVFVQASHNLRNR